MTSLESIQQLIAPELKALNERITSSLTTTNQLLNQVVETYLKTKGKQIRPILVMLSARLLGNGTINDDVISAAAGVEMLHNASLIHDDVVDDTKLRRDRPTINSIWDNHIAVLVGDFFVSTALQQAILTDDIRIIKTLSNLGKTLSLGEIDQIYTAQNHILSEKAYMGGYAIKANDDAIMILRQFAQLLGLCFQIRDDIFDYFEDPKIGKPTGNDLREGKVTLPLLHVLLQKDLPDNEKMTALVRKDNLDNDEIATLIGYARQHGGIEYAYDTMQQLRNQAVELLNNFPPSDTRQAFISIFDYIIARDY